MPGAFFQFHPKLLKNSGVYSENFAPLFQSDNPNPDLGLKFLIRKVYYDGNSNPKPV